MGIGFLARPWLTADRMQQFGQYAQLMRELRMTDSSFFSIYMRMEPIMLDEILRRDGLESKRVNTNFRKTFEPDAKLARGQLFKASLA